MPEEKVEALIEMDITEGETLDLERNQLLEELQKLEEEETTLSPVVAKRVLKVIRGKKRAERK